MREAEFIQLLDEVDAALNPAIFDRWTEQPDLYQLPVAANDNETPWNHAPFPKGWIASC